MEDKEYTTQDKIQDFLGSTIDTSLTDIILAVQKYIDGYTGRSFKACGVASARLFDGKGKQELLIDDCIEVTKVETGNDCYGNTFTEIESTGQDRYILLPNNYSIKEIPITKILLTSRIFDFGIQNARITAKWGYSEEAPADIGFVATILGAGMYNSKNSINGVNSETIGSYSVSYNNAEQWSAFNKAISLLNRYKTHYL
jgi:hypothetical protein